MALSVRGQEATVAIIKGGELLKDSFTDILNFSLDADAEVSQQKFLGRTRDKGDLRVNGYTFSWANQVQGPEAFQKWKDLADADKQANAQPTISLLVFIKYRGASTASQTIRLTGVTMKLDSMGFDDKDSYIQTSWSGFAEDATETTA